jgi:sporulation protein YlmC with PRC-barrel domain
MKSGPILCHHSRDAPPAQAICVGGAYRELREIMPRLRQLLKLEVYAVDEGVSVGRPADILVDPERHEVALLVLSYGKIPETAVVCPADAIGIFSNESLTIKSLKALHIAVHDKKSLEGLERGIRLRGRTVITAQGKRLGQIAGIEVDEKGKVARYLLRKPRLGLFRPMIPMAPGDINKLGTDVMIARDPSARKAIPSRKAS